MQRKTQRAAFTKIHNDLMSAFDTQSEDVELQFMLLKDQWEVLETVNANYMQKLQEGDNIVEKDVQDGLTSHLEYKTKFYKAKLKYERQFPKTPSDASGSESMATPVQQVEAPFKRPVMEMVKFDGSVGQWLQFWSSFQKYDEDQQLSKIDKLRYLQMSMVKDSEADLMIRDFTLLPLIVMIAL